MNTDQWIHTGEAENGLQIWVTEYNEDGVRYIKIAYKDNEGNRVGKIQDYPVAEIRLLNALVDTLETENGL
ncbi:hypothetical protein [Paenibacillus terrae]|uniref:Transcriptional coactivator p15 (PC4) C-terminal domain-containing protein n=1 Tax=Paenibacillus terrae TaxID=159743 RepID=A0A0D7WX53_9BACL|nr:hypothetical protein [Paenibacillus terrae]KJD43761.1 hypothetical protein QD47_20645 [Paenibacillus terrae]